VLLGHLLEDRLRSVVDQVLGLLQAEVREGTHLLDDLDLLVAGAGEDDVELVLLLAAATGVATTGSRGAGSRDGHGGRSGDAELLLELLEQLAQLEDGHVGDRLEDLVLGCHVSSPQGIRRQRPRLPRRGRPTPRGCRCWPRPRWPRSSRRPPRRGPRWSPR